MCEALAQCPAHYPGCCGCSLLVRELLSSAAESWCFWVTSQGLYFISLLFTHVPFADFVGFLGGGWALEHFFCLYSCGSLRKRSVVAGMPGHTPSVPEAVPTASQASAVPEPSLVGTGPILQMWE